MSEGTKIGHRKEQARGAKKTTLRAFRSHVKNDDKNILANRDTAP